MLGLGLIAAVIFGLMVLPAPSGATPAEPGQKGLDLEGVAAYDESGYSVALSADGHTIAIGEPGFRAEVDVGARGRVRVFRWNGSAWDQVGAPIDGEYASNSTPWDGDRSGSSVALSADGNTVAIGALYNDGPGNPLDPNDVDYGHVRVYRWNGVTEAWVQLGVDIDGEAAYDRSGWSVALSADGNTVAIGVVRVGRTGRVRVYRWDGVTEVWLKSGVDIGGNDAGSGTGRSVALSADGNTVAIGVGSAPGAPPGAPGRVRLYQWGGIASGWVQRGSDIDGEEGSGLTVALSADGITVAIGGPGTGARGRVRVFGWNGSAGTWVQRGSDIDGEAPGDYAGVVALSADGNTVAIGAPYNAGADRLTPNSGHVRVFRWNGSASSWVQRGSDIDGEAPGDESGQSVALSADGNIVAVGAPFNDARAGLAEYAGYVRVYAFAVLENVVVPPVVDAPVGAVPPVVDAPVGAVPPSVSCVPLSPVAGTTITCTVTGGDPGIDILWRAAYNPVIAEAGVTLDASGAGEFSFVVPGAALGLTVELVEWTAPLSLGVVGGPVPSSVASGEGPVPSSVPAGEGPVPMWPILLIALVTFGLLRRGMRVQG